MQVTLWLPACNLRRRGTSARRGSSTCGAPCRNVLAAKTAAPTPRSTDGKHLFSRARVLLGPALLQSPGRFAGTHKRLQGGVQLPTGGRYNAPDGADVQARERSSQRSHSSVAARWEVSRSGRMPEPTVIVRMKEDGVAVPLQGPCACLPCGVFRSSFRGER